MGVKKKALKAMMGVVFYRALLLKIDDLTLEQINAPNLREEFEGSLSGYEQAQYGMARAELTTDDIMEVISKLVPKLRKVKEKKLRGCNA